MAYQRFFVRTLEVGALLFVVGVALFLLIPCYGDGGCATSIIGGVFGILGIPLVISSLLALLGLRLNEVHKARKARSERA